MVDKSNLPSHLIATYHEYQKHVLTGITTIYRSLWGQYHFSSADYLHYVKYAGNPSRGIEFPQIEISEAGKSFIKLTIRHKEYYWPASFDWSVLRWMYQEVFVPSNRNFHAYEYGEVKIRPGDWVVDCGACEGFFTQYALQKEACVLAVEPVPSLVGALQHTFAPEIAGGKVELRAAACGAQSGPGYLQVLPDQLYESKVSGKGDPIQIAALDDLVGERQIDFIKMDIEGAEMDAVRGARETIIRHKPRLAIAVYHAYENAALVNQLLRAMRPDYHLLNRGIFAKEGVAPRPFMVFGW